MAINIVPVSPGTDTIHTALASISPGDQTTLKLSEGYYELSYPAWIDKSDVALEGAGVDRTFIRTNGYFGNNGLIVSPSGVVPDATTYRPTLLSSLLDSSVAGLPSKAIKLDNTVQLRTWGSGFTYRANAYLQWDAWRSLNYMTLQFAIRHDTTYADGCRFCGFDGGENDPSPWILDFNLHVNEYTMTVRLSTGNLVAIRVNAGTAPYTGVQKVTIQLSMADGKAWAWVNDTKVSCTYQGLYPGCKFAENENASFSINGFRNGIFDNSGCVGLLCGFSIDYKLVYNTANNSLTRLDSTTLNDYNRYFDYGTNGPQLLINLDPTNDVDSGRWLLAKAGFASERVMFTKKITETWIANIRMKDFTVWGQNNLGHNISIGGIINLKINDVRCFGGSCGIGPTSYEVSYPVTLTDLNLAGKDAGLAMVGNITYIYNLWNVAGQRKNIYLSGCSGTLINSFSPQLGDEQQYSILFRNSDDTTGFKFINAGFDAEGGVGPYKAGWKFDMVYNGSIMISIENSGFGATAGHSPAVVLQARNGIPVTTKCILLMSGCEFTDVSQKVIDNRNPNTWRVKAFKDENIIPTGSDTTNLI
jgi:hypothetical protein